MIPVPEQIRRRAWEVAFELDHNFRDRLTLEQLVLCVTAEIAGPDAIGWHYAGRLFALWSDVVVVRV